MLRPMMRTEIPKEMHQMTKKAPTKSKRKCNKIFYRPNFLRETIISIPLPMARGGTFWDLTPVQLTPAVHSALPTPDFALVPMLHVTMLQRHNKVFSLFIPPK